MRLTGGVNRPANLGDPQLHAVVLEQREGQAELVAVERAVRLTDDDRAEPAGGVFERFQQQRGLRAPFPGQ